MTTPAPVFSVEMQLLTLPESDLGPGFALIVLLLDADRTMTPADITAAQDLWCRAGNDMGARATIVLPPGIDLTVHWPAGWPGGEWSVPPGPCPSAFRLLGTEGEMYSCELLAGHAGRHRCSQHEFPDDRPLMWGEVQLWPPKETDDPGSPAS